MKEEKCNCSFCKLREIGNENAKEQLRWLKESEDKLIKYNQRRNIELIELCVKGRPQR